MKKTIFLGIFLTIFCVVKYSASPLISDVSGDEVVDGVLGLEGLKRGMISLVMNQVRASTSKEASSGNRAASIFCFRPLNTFRK